ncbi:MAG: ABC transporter permease [Chloroflexi bacterium]|nr:ABC transporter permease [Chloroflexota bacterium]MBU1750593.1 ABC transporter permease [Chloroflexota bacterium]
MRPGAPREYIEEIRHNLGLDKPLPEQYIDYLSRLLSLEIWIAPPGTTEPTAELLIPPQNPILTVRYAAPIFFQFLLIPDDPRLGLGIWPGQTVSRNSYLVRFPSPDTIAENLPIQIGFMDMGVSISPVRGRPVAWDIGAKFPATLELAVCSIVITMVVGVSTGAYAAHKRRSAADYGFRVYSIVIYAMPVFWLGLMLQLIFGVGLNLLPVYGRIDTGMAPAHITGLYLVDSLITLNLPSFMNALIHLILPSLTLGLYLSGIFTRLTRANMLGTLQQDFITAARARGIPERTVVYKHALKNAFIPILTMMGLQFAALLAGAVLTETTFSWPGMGSFVVDRIGYRDFASIQGSVVFFAFLIASVSLLVDIVYARLDPRIRY